MTTLPGRQNQGSAPPLWVASPRYYPMNLEGSKKLISSFNVHFYKMRAYKVKTYDDIERDIDVYCMIFGVLFYLAYFTILLSGIYLATHQ